MPSAGDRVNHYTVLQAIGRGGTGEVFLAQDMVLGRRVALKFLPESDQLLPETRKRFLREAKAAAALDHPFICKIYDTGEAEGRAYIAMEYVAGETLKDRLAQGSMPVGEALQRAGEIAEALEEAHNHGIVHRDLKPANIMLMPQGHAKVMDFSLAKLTAPGRLVASDDDTQSGDLTKLGALIGTIAYMSPEQARGQPVDARSDIFSFGVVLYEMLSGTHPFRRASQIETLSSISNESAPELDPHITTGAPAIRKFMNKVLAKEPSARYQTMKEVREDLREIAEEMIPRRRPAWVVWSLAGAGTLTIALLFLTWWLARRGPIAESPAARPRLSVLIADFQNDTGESVFDGTLEPRFTVALEGASFISCYDRGKGREIGAQLKPGSRGLGEALASLVARREGINAVVAGTIARSGKGYSVSVRTIDVASGKETMTREADATNREGVLALVAKLAAPLREQLGDTSFKSVQLAAGETFTAGSLEAAHNYALAQELQWAGKEEESIRYYQLAIQLDPNFGRAYAGLAVIYANRGQRDEAEKYYQSAMARIDLMTERERYRTRGGYYLMVRNYPKAIEEFRALVAQYPADTAGAYNLALAYFQSRELSSALKEVRRVAAQDPNNVFFRTNASFFATYSGDFETAVADAREALKRNPTYAFAFVPLALSQLALGKPDEAEGTYRQLSTISAYGASVAAHGLADIAVYQGRLTDAEKILEGGIAGDTATKNAAAAAAKWAILAQALSLNGKVKGALDAAAQAVADSNDDGILVSAAQVYLQLGKEGEARKLAAQLGVRLAPDPQAYSKLIEAEARLKRADASGAIRGLHESLKLSDTWLAHFDLGLAYLQAGAFPEAHSEFDTCMKRRGEATCAFLDDWPSWWRTAPLFYYLGRAQEGLKSPGAAASYQAYISIKEKGGEDPLLADARRRLESR